MVKIKRVVFGHNVVFRTMNTTWLDSENHHCTIEHDGTILYIEDINDFVEVPLTNVAYMKRLERRNHEPLPVQYQESAPLDSKKSKVSKTVFTEGT